MNLIEKMNPNLEKITISKIRQFDQEVSKIPSILKLTLGEPDFFTPDAVKSAGVEAIQNNQSHYTGMAGLEALRKAATHFVKRRYHLTYNPEDEVLVTVGVTEAIATCLLSILVAGDQVLIPAPAYPGYAPLITLSGAEAVEIDTRADQFILTPEKLEKALTENKNVKALILNSPANPTGVIYSREQLAALAEIIKRHEIFVISDEVYSELNYIGLTHSSIAEFLPEQTFVLNGLSKSHAMTGWRIGFIFAPSYLTAELKKTHQYLVTAATTLSQVAGIEALTREADAALPMRNEYRLRRDFILEKMTSLGFEIIRPDGAFYIFAKIPADLTENSYNFCLDFAKKKAIAFIPGSAFGEYGESYIRLSYAASMEIIEKAMMALAEYIKEKRTK